MLDLAVVLDPHFGDRLVELARRSHVWVCRSPENLAAVDAVWKEPELYETGRGATIFSKCEEPEAVFLAELDTIDLHHPGWEVMYIYGLDWTLPVKQILAEYGVTRFISMTEGFVATRPAQSAT